MEVREEVKWFAENMERILKTNDWKGGWDECSLSYLFEALKREMVELEEALVNEDAVSVVKECCDVANFAMMIADKFRPTKYRT